MPLLPIMVGLEADMNDISDGLWKEDFEKVQQGAENITNHPKISQEELAKVKEILGEEEFRGTEAEVLVHLRNAVKDRDPDVLVTDGTLPHLHRRGQSGAASTSN